MSFSFFWTIPFIALLLSIAVVPLIAPHFWEKNRNKAFISFALAAPVALHLFQHDLHLLTHSLLEYASFISLLLSLFIISGGIYLQGDLKATPAVNTAFLGIGAILANFIGTTGASMLLIRPLLKTNSERKNVHHIPIFFIFIVSNIGGLLTPIGDPPLFLGFLRGVPFFWTLQNLFPIWFLGNGILLVLFYFWDRACYRTETPTSLKEDALHEVPLKILGSFNFLLLACVIVSVFLSSPYREISLIILALLSYKITPRSIHQSNQFSFHPISEVAILFAGIFITMVPALELLRVHAPQLGINQPYQFFWLTGFLSSFLDNAPTYLTFFTVAQGLPVDGFKVVDINSELLKAISAGAVLMGANTYIGNGPNFMVKAIADASGFKTPSFFGYMIYSVGILIPLFILMTFVFFI